MWSLPQSDEAWLSEAPLLACALVGSHPTYLNGSLQLLEQYAETAQRDLEAVAEDPQQGIAGMSARIRQHQGDELIREGWAEVRPDRSGRLHRVAPPSAIEWRTVDVDLARTPARDRLMALTHRAWRIPCADEQTAYLLQFMRNAIAITAADAVAPIRRGLLTITKELQLGSIAQPGMAPLDLVNAQQQRLMGVLWAEREVGSVDGATAADVLIGILLASGIAQCAGPDGPLLWATYLMHADRQIVTSQPIEPVIARAVREGFSEVVADLAAGLLDCGEQLQRAARDLETFDRGRFAKLLYDGYPYLHAARTLAGCLIESIEPRGVDSPEARIFRVADELAVRFVDGMFHQWFDFDDYWLDVDRELIAQALSAGDDRAMRRILVGDETALHRPRSARGYLLRGTKGGT
ncbi:hypothetical protein AB0C34_26690 [Nocardia sp. NPDC049220]|uniref:hypothetical protein n=1 Tax=Nocardia sp. NPDC049220 TaxID=3155273 RepID=UPI00340FA8B7